MRNIVLKSVLSLSALLLVGCSAITELRLDMADKLFGREPPNPPAKLNDIAITQPTKLNWSAQLGETASYDLTPALEAGHVFMANAEGELTKLNVETGQQAWRINVGEAISGGVGAGGGLVLVGTNRGHIFAHDVNGELVWKSQLSSEILSAPQYFDGMVIARSGDNRIYGLDAADGTRKWVYERKVPALTLRSSAGIVVDDGAVYAGFSGGKMAAIRADNGRLLWEATVAVPKGVTEIERIADITSLPVVAGPVVYAIAYQGRAAAINRVNGKVLWNRQISSYAGMNFAHEKLYVSHALGSIYSLDYATGRTFWRQGDLLNRRLTKPVLVKDMVVVGDLEGYVHFLNIDDGKFVSRIRVNDNAVMSIIPGEDSSQVIVATRGGGLYSISTQGERSESSLIDAIDTIIDEREEKAEEDATTSDAESQSTEPDTNETQSESKSILFKKDSVFLPEGADEGGPGIVLPKSE